MDVGTFVDKIADEMETRTGERPYLRAVVEVLGTANTGKSIQVLIEHVTDSREDVLLAGAGNTVEEAIIDSLISEVVALQNEED